MKLSEGDRIAPLEREHKEIARQLDRVHNAIKMHVHGSLGRRDESIRLLKSTVEAHLLREEATVYEPLRLRMGRDGPIDTMTREHRSIRQALGRLVSASDEYGAGRLQLGTLQNCFDSLQREIGEHIEKEEKIFWLADLKL